MNELKVQMSASSVDARDLDDHALPQLKTAPRVGARQRERVLVKLKPLTTQTLDGNQSLDLRQIKAHKEPHVADPRDRSGIALAQAILIVLGNLDFLRCMAGSIGRTLGIAARAADLRQDARKRLPAFSDQPWRTH